MIKLVLRFNDLCANIGKLDYIALKLFVWLSSHNKQSKTLILLDEATLLDGWNAIDRVLRFTHPVFLFCFV